MLIFQSYVSHTNHPDAQKSPKTSFLVRWQRWSNPVLVSFGLSCNWLNPVVGPVNWDFLSTNQYSVHYIYIYTYILYIYIHIYIYNYIIYIYVYIQIYVYDMYTCKNHRGFGTLRKFRSDVGSEAKFSQGFEMFWFPVIRGVFNGRSPGSNWWSYVSTIFLAIFWGSIPWNLALKNRPYTW